jgi:hypothetical protein
MSIELRIDRLVIDEAVLGGERAGSVRAALERELAHTLSREGSIEALSRIGAVTHLPACGLPDVKLARGDLGGRIAAAVGEGLGVPRATRMTAGATRGGGRHG